MKSLRLGSGDRICPDARYLAANKPLKIIIDTMYQYAMMLSLGRQDCPPAFPPMCVRYVVLLTPSIAASLQLQVCPGLLAERSIRSMQRIRSPQPTIALSPLAATLMDFLASVANKRLTARLSPLDATLTKYTGGWSLNLPTLSTRAPTYSLCFQTVAHSLARRKTQLFSFQSIPHSLSENTRGGGEGAAC